MLRTFGNDIWKYFLFNLIERVASYLSPMRALRWTCFYTLQGDKFRIWQELNHGDIIYFKNFSMVIKFLQEPSDCASLASSPRIIQMSLQNDSKWSKSPPERMAKCRWVTRTFRSDFTTTGFDLIANCGYGLLISHNTNLGCKMLANCERPSCNCRIQIILNPLFGLGVWIRGFNRTGHAYISAANPHLSLIMHGNRLILQIKVWNILDSCLANRFLKYSVPLERAEPVSLLSFMACFA